MNFFAAMLGDVINRESAAVRGEPVAPPATWALRTVVGPIPTTLMASTDTAQLTASEEIDQAMDLEACLIAHEHYGRDGWGRDPQHYCDPCAVTRGLPAMEDES